MKRLFPLCLLSLHAFALSLALAGGSLPRATPESQGVSSGRLLRFVEALDAKAGGLNSVMLVRHGKVVMEGWWAPYTPDARHELYSLSKSFTSTAVGFAVAEGLLSVDDEVLKFFPDEAPAEPSANLKAMRVRDLLTMSAGHQDETSSAPDRISPRSFLAHPVPHKPGTHFRYNSSATFMLSAIVQKRSGKPILEYLQPRLFEPLGISNPEWATNSQGVNLGGSGLSVTTEDIARFGQFYLQKGSWNGRQLLPASWVDQATGRQVSNGSNPASDWDQGYGFQFWRCRNGAYRGDGAYGQYCVVLPEHDAVLAITSGLGDLQGVLNIVWEELLPAFAPKALRRDKPALAALASRLASLGIQVPTSVAAGGRLPGRRIVFPANDSKLEWMRFDGDGTVLKVAVRSEGGEESFECGRDDWRRGTRTVAGRTLPVAVRGTWVSESEFVMTTAFTTTPFVQTERFKVSGDTVVRESRRNVGPGSGRAQSVTGRLE